jgi:predicted MFS family arabinose efflux permease
LQTVLGFDEKNVAHLMLVSGLASIFSQTLLLRPLMHLMRERGVIIVALLGCILESGGFAATAFYPKKWIAFTLTAPGCLSDLSFAAISSLKSINCSEKVLGAWNAKACSSANGTYYSR